MRIRIRGLEGDNCCNIMLGTTTREKSIVWFGCYSPIQKEGQREREVSFMLTSLLSCQHEGWGGEGLRAILFPVYSIWMGLNTQDIFNGQTCSLSKSFIRHADLNLAWNGTEKPVRVRVLVHRGIVPCFHNGNCQCGHHYKGKILMDNFNFFSNNPARQFYHAAGFTEKAK